VSANPARIAQTITLTATFTGALPSGTVTFKDGTTTIGTSTIAAGQATLNLSYAAVSSHSLSAVYAGDANNIGSTSEVVNLNVIENLITYFHNDISATPLAETDAAGALIWKQSYRPYGDPVQPPNDDNKILYTGKPYDKDSGLTYMGARYYDPLIGRFMGVDPVGFRADNVHSFNRYAYANNNPYKFVDPDGRYAELAVEVVSLSVGYMSLRENISAGNTSAAITDGFGMLADIVGAAIPGVPGVAGLGIKASREAAELGAKEVRRTPITIMDKMVLEEAKKGKGINITEGLSGGKLKDPKFEGMEKWSYSETSNNKIRSEVHYIRNPKTDELMDFKFKD
jgi:RHS repeat-associated protein